MNERPDKSTWEDQINALLDGELPDEQAKLLRLAAEHDHALARAIIAATELHQIISEIPAERAPSSLRSKLRQIPRQMRARERLGFLQLRWGMVMATLIVAVTITVSQMWPNEPSDVEIAQARQDLNLALTYLARASRKTRHEIALNIGHGFSRPVTKNTVRILADQFRLNKE